MIVSLLPPYSVKMKTRLVAGSLDLQCTIFINLSDDVLFILALSSLMIPLGTPHHSITVVLHSP
jgi:hypothetical protein